MDAIVSDWHFKDQPVKLIDTCGVYRGWQYPRTDSGFLEPGMATRKAIRRSHVVVLCVDAQAFRKMTYYTCPSQFEINLGAFVIEEGRGLIIAVNKWDLVEEDEQPKFRDDILKRIGERLSQIKGVPVVFMSAKYNLNLAMLMTRTLALHKRWSARLPTSKLNSWLQRWMIRWPVPWRHGQKTSVKYMTQTRARPPTFVLWTNTTYGEMPRNYLRQLQNAMREEFRISGVPIRFIYRSTLMPKPRKKLSKRDMLRWKRIGPKQAKAAMNLSNTGRVKQLRQTD
jgi:GTP-binding protein